MNWPDGALVKPGRSAGQILSASELQDAIGRLSETASEDDDYGRIVVFPLCPKCRCPYNIPSHPDHCEGGLALKSAEVICGD